MDGRNDTGPCLLWVNDTVWCGSHPKVAKEFEALTFALLLNTTQRTDFNRIICFKLDWHTPDIKLNKRRGDHSQLAPQPTQHRGPRTVQTYTLKNIRPVPYPHCSWQRQIPAPLFGAGGWPSMILQAVSKMVVHTCKNPASTSCFVSNDGGPDPQMTWGFHSESRIVPSSTFLPTCYNSQQEERFDPFPPLVDQ
mmetsp:Transcript_23626/g.49050  ORF Transcript_23626/g.49050 Transcript_23626/m.49050 type:complete len:194 (+) Transcript_23626:1505-2086(+)